MIKEIVQKIRNILFTPREFWEDEKEKGSENLMPFWGYYAPLALVAATAVFIGSWFGSAHFYIGFALFKALRILILFAVTYFASVLILNKLLPFYEGEKDVFMVKKLMGYSLTPYLLVSVVTGLFPALYPADIIGLYSAYLLWTGIKALLKVPEKKQLSYTVASVLLCIFVSGVFSILLSKIFVELY